MSLKHGLLGFLDSEGKMTGYDLNKLFKLVFGYVWPAQRSQIYHELQSMEKKGWLTYDIIIQTDKPNKKEYSITKTGKEELERWLEESSVDDHLRIKSTFLMKLFFSGNGDLDDLIDSLKELKNECNDLIKFSKITYEVMDYFGEMEFAKNQVFSDAMSRFEEEYAKLCMSWADETIENLEKQKEELANNE